MPWLTDRKWAHIRVEGQAFGDVPLNVELKLEVWDSPNSAGIVIDAVRCCKLALNHGVGGQLDGPSSYLMKSPHNQRPDEVARADTEKFIATYAGLPGARGKAPAKRQGGGESRHAPPREGLASDGRAGRGPPHAIMEQMAPPLSIAHVTPYPWEAEGSAVNTTVERVAGELSKRGHRVLVLAPSRSQDRVRDSRRELRAARGEPHALLRGTDGGTPRVIAVGEVLDVPTTARRRASGLSIDVARTVEELLSTVELDIVHVHEPFAPSTSNAALRHSRALNVGSFHSPNERLLSTLVARRFVESFFGRLDARTASLPATAELMASHFPGEYSLVADDEDAATEFERIYASLTARRHTPPADEALRERLGERPLIDVDLHMHTDHSGDCATPVELLLATAQTQGLGAIAVTDHNEISGALEAARDRVHTRP